MDLKSLTLSAIEVCQQAGKFIQQEAATFDHSKIEHKGKHDLVSYVDKEAEKILVKGLEALLPEAGFVTEEKTINKTGETYNWIIDPLDGTSNFIQGLPLYAVTIALAEGDEIIMGIVIELNRNECFYAWKGGGAYLNNQPIKVAQKSDFSQAFIVTGFPAGLKGQTKKYLEILQHLVENTNGVRRSGSAATDLAYVACGRFDAFYEFNINIWDVAAGVILIQEAGGLCSNFKGVYDFKLNSKVQILGSAKSVHPDLVKVLKEF